MTNQIPNPKSQIRKIFVGVFLVFSFCFFVLPQPATAALVPCGPTAVKAEDKVCTFNHLAELLIGIYNWLLGLAGVVAILFVVYGGFLMVYGWTTEQPESVYKEGQLTVRRALWGLVLVLSAYLVINTLLMVVFGADDLNTFFSKLFSG